MRSSGQLSGQEQAEEFTSGAQLPPRDSVERIIWGVPLNVSVVAISGQSKRTLFAAVFDFAESQPAAVRQRRTDLDPSEIAPRTRRARLNVEFIKL
jgi:hypothetical protein